MNRSLLLAIAGVAGAVFATCTSGGPSGSCPPTMPTGACTGTAVGPWCQYGTQQCRCGGPENPWWACEPATCPATPIDSGAACAQPGLVCDPGFERACFCLDPERTWFCCGTGATCPGSGATEGSWCCAGSTPCEFRDGGVMVRATCDRNHWRFASTPVDAGPD